MRATIVKLPARHVIIMGDGEHKEIEFANTAYQAAEVAKQYGATELKMGDHRKCLSYTHMEASEPASSSGSSAEKNQKPDGSGSFGSD